MEKLKSLKKTKVKFLKSFIVPKNLKGDPLEFLISILFQNIKIEGGPFRDIYKNFKGDTKKVSQCRKKGEPVVSFGLVYYVKKKKNERVPFALP